MSSRTGVRVPVLSLGAGVQSTALLLMALDGELEELGPRPERVIFADTGWEPQAVYRHLAWLTDLVGDRLAVDVVSAGNIRSDLLRGAAGLGKRFASLPLYVRDSEGNLSMLRRQCTKDYKLRPIRRRLRALGLNFVELWLGISWDESLRQRESGLRWIVNRYPLVELRLTREDCRRWLVERGYPEPPKSACIGCPFHDKGLWAAMRAGDRASWYDAVAVDESIRRLPRIHGEVFLHRSGRPLAGVGEGLVGLGDVAEGQVVEGQVVEGDGDDSGFLAECQGLCGT